MNERERQIVEVRTTLDVLFEPGSVVELRVLNSRFGTKSGYYNDFDTLAQHAVALDHSPGTEGTYVTLNPVDPALLGRSCNGFIAKPKHTTSDRDIVCRRWLPIDCDAIRPAGISASNVQHDRALQRSRDVARWLVDVLQWPRPLFADSGNGAHVLVPIALANDERGLQRVQRCLEAIAGRFNDDVVKIDTVNANAARIWKLYGTHSRKGESLPDRPHRRARLLSLDEAPV